MRGQHFWNYFVSRKARCKILHSAWADTSVAWTEPPSWKTMLKTTLDNGPRMKWLASKVTLMMKDHVSGHGTTLSVSGSPDHIRAASWKEEKEREKESTKVYPKEAEEHSLAKNKHKIPKFGQKRTLLGGPQETKARKACQKAMMTIRRVVFALTTQTKAQARIITRTKAKERTKKEKARKELILNPDFQPQKHPTKKDTAMLGNETIGLPAMGLTIPGLQILGGFAQKLTLHGWRYPLWILLTIRHTWFLTLAAHGRLDRERQSKDWRSMHGIMVLRRNLAVVMSPSCSPTPRQKPAWKVALSTFQRHHHVLPRLMCLRQVTCPSCFLLLRWKTWVWPLNWIQKETRLRSQLLACFLLQLRFHSGTYCVGPDESYVSAYD